MNLDLTEPFAIFKAIIISVLTSTMFMCGTIHGQSTLPKLFLFAGSGEDLQKQQNILSNPYVCGVQVIYTWKTLEPEMGRYDFSKIKNDIRFLSSINKKLFIQIQDRSFEPELIYVPDYIRKEEIYHGGVEKQYDFPGEGLPISEGWVARVWDPAVRGRFQALIKELSKEFDGKVFGINLPETAVDFDSRNPPQGFTPDSYFYGELRNIKVLKNSFHETVVLQYVNFFPGEWNNDHNYMGRMFSYAIKHHIGLGGPDVIPNGKSQMANSYRYFHESKGQISPVAIAIQEPDYTYRNPQTNDYYTFDEFYSFSTNFLGANILFWNLQEPFLSNKLIPEINSQHFARCS